MALGTSHQVVFRRHTDRVYLCVALLILLTHLYPLAVYRSLEDHAWAWRQRRLDRTLPSEATRVTLVQWKEPPSRTELARALDALTARGAAVVVIDLPLPADEEDEDATTRLAEALVCNGHVVLCSYPKGRVSRELELPDPRLARAAAAVGYAALRLDVADRAKGVVLHGLTDDRSRFGAIVEALRVLHEVPEFNVLVKRSSLELRPPPGKHWEPLRFRIQPDGAMFVDYTLLELPPHLPFEALLDATAPEEPLKGRVVLLGTSVAGVVGVATPFGFRVGQTELQACALEGLLRGRVPCSPPETPVAALLFVLGLLLIAVGYRAAPRWTLVANLLVAVPWVALGTLARPWWGLEVPLARPLGLLVLLALVGVLRHLLRPVVGVQRLVATAAQETEAQEALERGLDLLRQGEIDASIEHFQTVARLGSALRERGQLLLALVFLRKGESAAASALVEAMDFEAVPGEEVYDLASEMEQGGQLETAQALFGFLSAGHGSYRDASHRLDEIRLRLSRVSEEDVAEMVARKVLDRRFRSVELIGRGGMGYVYRATDAERDNQRVALKTLTPYYANNPEVYERFLREARGIADLDHPCLIRIFDVFAVNLPYYSMEYLDSPTLKDLLREVGRFSPSAAVELAIQCCDGMACAHEHGVVHRDLKPENILIDSDRRPRIIDFGIAKFTQRTSVTQVDQRLGTPLYMSPEQFAGRPLDHRTDIYTLGVILYEWLAGAPPFENEFRGPDEPVPDLPEGVTTSPELMDLIRRAMAIDPDARYATMAEMKAALEGLDREAAGEPGGEARGIS